MHMVRSLSRLSLSLLFFFFFALPARDAAAEFYLSAYAGATFTVKNDVRVVDDQSISPILGFGGPTDYKLKDVSFDTSFMGGGKVGYWLDVFPYVGFEFDVAHFNPDVPSQTVAITGNAGAQLCGCPPPTNALIPPGATVRLGEFQSPIHPVFPTRAFDRYSLGVTGLGLHVMGRLRLLQSSDYPQGRLQPYVGVGPAFFFSEVTLRPFGGNVFATNQATQVSGNTAVGIQGVAGVKFFVRRYLSLFGEYKLSHFQPEFKTALSQAGNRAESTLTKFELTSHHAYGGVAFHFDLP